MALVIKKPTSTKTGRTTSKVPSTSNVARSVSAPPTFAVPFGKGSNTYPVLQTLAADRVSLYLKLANLIRSVIDSGKPSELTKMRSYLRGVMQPSSADRCNRDLNILKKYLEEYATSRNPDTLLGILSNTDGFLKSKKV